MRVKLIVAIALFCIPFIADAQKTVLFGTNPTYRGQTINVYSCSDYISGTKKLVGSAEADSAGNFRIEIDIDRTCRLTLDLGRMSGILYADTSMTYNIVLPDFRPKTKGDILNPYFEPDEFLVGIKNPDRYNINMYVDMFDYYYEELLERNYYTLFKKPVPAAVDSIIGEIEHSFDTIPNEFFRTYREYKYAWLKFVSYMRDWRYMSREYFDGHQVAYENPAYMDLFNQMFTNFLKFYMNTREGERIYSDIALAKSPVKAKQTLSNSLAITNDTLQEMVLLKGIHDALYDCYFTTNSLLIALDSIKSTSKIQQHRQIAQNIEQKNQIARVGTMAPEFCLADTAGVFRSVDEYKGKYVYLNFVSIDNYTCVQDLEQLKLLNEKTKGVMDVVSIAIDDDFDSVKKMFKRNGYNWTLLDVKGDKSVVDRYKVKVYPSYFLIDTDGTLCMSPAISPSEDFESRFKQIFQSRQH
jgi:peroxiredoxin